MIVTAVGGEHSESGARRYLPYQPPPRWSDGPFEELNGFQASPVNWTINNDFKRAFFSFFSWVAEVTGYPGEARQAKVVS